VYELGHVFRSRVIARVATLIMAIGPFEIIHSSRVCVGHPLAYCAFFLLLLLYKRDDRPFFWFVFIVCLTVVAKYYTGSLVIIIMSIGFIVTYTLMTLQQDGWRRETFRDIRKKECIHKYAIIAGASLLYLGAFSKMTNYTMGLFQTAQPAARLISQMQTLGGEGEFMLYSDPTIFGLSALNWQILLFVLCGSTFFWRVRAKKIPPDQFHDLVIIGGPVLLLACAFVYADYPIRAFDYGAIIFLLYLFVPRPGRRVVTTCCVVLIYLLSFQIIHDKKIFFDIAKKKIGLPIIYIMKFI